MKIFVAGATGAIGRRLLPRLISAGHSVTAMTRSAAKADQLRGNGVPAVALDAFDRDGLASALKRERPEVVMHQLTDLAARGGWAEQQLHRGELKAGLGVASFVHVDDAAEAAVRALHWPSGAVNVVDDEPAPMAVWLTAFAEAVSAPLPQVTAEAAPYEQGASNAKARGLGWAPRYPSWRDGFVLGLG